MSLEILAKYIAGGFAGVFIALILTFVYHALARRKMRRARAVRRAEAVARMCDRLYALTGDAIWKVYVFEGQVYCDAPQADFIPTNGEAP